MTGTPHQRLSHADGHPTEAVKFIFIWRLVNFIIGIFFLLATIANVNDNDWYIWIPIYLVPTILCFAVAIKEELLASPAWRLTCIVHLSLCVAYSIYHLVLEVVTLSNNVINPLQHETGREFAGLLIIIFWLGLCRFTSFGRPASSSSPWRVSLMIAVTVALSLLPIVVWSICYISDWHTKIGHCAGMFSTL